MYVFIFIVRKKHNERQFIYKCELIPQVYLPDKLKIISSTTETGVDMWQITKNFFSFQTKSLLAIKFVISNSKIKK